MKLFKPVVTSVAAALGIYGGLCFLTMCLPFLLAVGLIGFLSPSIWLTLAVAVIGMGGLAVYRLRFAHCRSCAPKAADTPNAVGALSLLAVPASPTAAGARGAQPQGVSVRIAHGLGVQRGLSGAGGFLEALVSTGTGELSFPTLILRSGFPVPMAAATPAALLADSPTIVSTG